MCIVYSFTVSNETEGKLHLHITCMTVVSNFDKDLITDIFRPKNAGFQGKTLLNNYLMLLNACLRLLLDNLSTVRWDCLFLVHLFIKLSTYWDIFWGSLNTKTLIYMHNIRITHG